MPAFDPLKQRMKIWACWSPPSKQPLQQDGTPAKSNNSDTWSTHAECQNACDLHESWGLSCMITEPYVGVDLDDCITDGVISPWARAIIDAAQTYTEISPSGTGLHLWHYRATGGLTPKNTKTKSVEIYFNGKFLTYTGDQVPGTPDKFSEYNPRIYSAAIAGVPGIPGVPAALAVSKPKTKLADVSQYSGRNEHLTSVAGLLRELHLEPDEIEQNLLNITSRLHLGNPLPAHEISTIARSIGSKPIAEVTGVPAAPEPEGWDINDLYRAKLPKRAALCKLENGTPVLTQFSVNQVSAWRGTGKTMFQLGWGIHLAAGKDFICYKNTGKPVRVLYIEGELPDIVLQERIELLAGGIIIEPGAFTIVSRDRMLAKGSNIPSLHTPEGRTFVERCIELYKPDVVFLDSIASLMQMGTNDEDNWIQFSQWVAVLRTSGLCIVQTMQMGKDSTRGSRGHSRLEDPLDVAIQLTIHDPELEYLNVKLAYPKFRHARKGVKPIIVTNAGDFKGWTWAQETDSLKSEALKLHERGMALDEIAKKLKKRYATVSEWLKMDLSPVESKREPEY